MFIFYIKQLVVNSKKIGGSAAGQTKRIEKRQKLVCFFLSTQLTATTVLQFNTVFSLFCFPALSAQTKDPIFFLSNLPSFFFAHQDSKLVAVGGKVCCLKKTFFRVSHIPHSKKITTSLFLSLFFCFFFFNPIRAKSHFNGFRNDAMILDRFNSFS